MNIAMIGLRGIPSKDGGVEVAVNELAPRLVKLGADVTVYTRKPYQNSKNKYYKNVRLINLPAINSKHFEAISHTMISTLYAISKKHDVIHYHAIGNTLLSFLPRIFGIKTIVTIHGLDWQREKWGKIAKTVLKLGEFTSVWFPNKTIAVSKKIQRFVNNKYKKNIFYVPNGVSTNQRSIQTRENSPNFLYILFLSRLVPEKGVHTLIQAYQKLKTKYKLLIVGGGTHTEKYIENLKGIAKSNSNIIFAGPLYGKEKDLVFKNASVFVLPSTIEGMPIVLLEAMSYGIPCIVSDIEENLEIVKNNENKIAYTFKRENINDLSIVLNTVLKDLSTTAKRIGFRAKKYVIKNYNWENIAKKMYEIYTSL